MRIEVRECDNSYGNENWSFGEISVKKLSVFMAAFDVVAEVIECANLVEEIIDTFHHRGAIGRAALLYMVAELVMADAAPFADDDVLVTVRGDDACRGVEIENLA